MIRAEHEWKVFWYCQHDDRSLKWTSASFMSGFLLMDLKYHYSDCHHGWRLCHWTLTPQTSLAFDYTDLRTFAWALFDSNAFPWSHSSCSDFWSGLFESSIKWLYVWLKVMKGCWSLNTVVWFYVWQFAGRGRLCFREMSIFRIGFRGFTIRWWLGVLRGLIRSWKSCLWRVPSRHRSCHHNLGHSLTW